MRRNLFAYILLPAFIFASCIVIDTDKPDPDPPPPVPPPEKEYHAQVLWQTEIFGRLSGLYTVLVEGQYGYFSVSDVPGGGSKIHKINLENGKVVWESPRIRQQYFDFKPNKIGGYIYFLGRSGLVFVFNDTAGDLAATVRPGKNETEASDYAGDERTAVSWGHYLFWGNKQGGLSRFDCDAIDFSKEPDEIQAITPDLVWDRDWRPKITTKILSEDGKIYFITRAGLVDNPEYVSILTVLDAETGEVIWERDMPLFEGGYYSSLVLNGEKLHVIENNNFCCDKNTGDTIYINYNVTASPYSDVKLHNNVFYYATAPYNRDEIVGVNADTGKREFLISDIWGTSPPQAYGDKLYLFHGGLRVYSISGNASGNDGFIGVDKSFEGENRPEYTFAYNDTLVLFRNYPGLLTAIKCE
jgi:outer membrane protein assembly factor BamB